jgi:ABC-type glycerol-3-phosphate transport system permease component
MANTAQTMDKVPAKKYRPSRFRLDTGRLILYAILLLGAIVAILPFFWMVSTSLMTLGETINRQWLPETPQFDNYTEAWREADFAKYFLNSVIITFTTIAGLLITSILAGYSFGRINFYGRDFVFAVLLATMMIPESVTMIPNFLLIRGSIIPLPGVSWLNRLPALTVPFMANAFSIFLLRQFFRKIPNELWDAARMDGAGHMRFLIQVCLPISKAPIPVDGRVVDVRHRSWTRDEPAHGWSGDHHYSDFASLLPDPETIYGRDCHHRFERVIRVPQ